MMADSRPVVVIGGGPAGLMAAETVRACGHEVVLFDRMGSVGRKILIAGKGGLNLTHSEPDESFRQRYSAGRERVSQWLDAFDANALRDWAAGLGVETVIGSSGRVFPADFKAAPLLRGWVRRLKQQGVVFRVGYRWTGWDAEGQLTFEGPDGRVQVRAAATILALGGGSWARLGSDGRWTALLAERGIQIQPLVPSNGGFEVHWTDHFRQRFAGQALKAVGVGLASSASTVPRVGEFVITDYGVEGGVIYALSADLREALARHRPAMLSIDLFPDLPLAELTRRLDRARGRRSFSEHLRRCLGLRGLRASLLRECCPGAAQWPAAQLAASLKALPLPLQSTRPMDEAISTAGGVALDELDDGLMLRNVPGVFCAGEMLAWDAPTGGYLLTACLASGRVAGQAAVHRLTPGDETRRCAS
ncbi:MAG: TIGR03862 family flavoprotein [Wenzhouxiangella sp.]